MTKKENLKPISDSKERTDHLDSGICSLIFKKQ